MADHMKACPVAMGLTPLQKRKIENKKTMDQDTNTQSSRRIPLFHAFLTSYDGAYYVLHGDGSETYESRWHSDQRGKHTRRTPA